MKKEDEFDVLYEAMITGDGSQAIMNQEARGQTQLVNSEALPIKFNFCQKDQFEAMGIVFGDPIDDLFVNATLPEGWKKERTDHSMWSKIVDDKGRERASIFYKAAFYDRDAFMNIAQRFLLRTEPVNGYGENYNRDDPNVIAVTDCSVRVWQSSVLPDVAEYGSNAHKNRKAMKDGFVAQGEAWLEERYPNWRDPLAHWD